MFAKKRYAEKALMKKTLVLLPITPLLLFVCVPNEIVDFVTFSLDMLFLVLKRPIVAPIC